MDRHIEDTLDHKTKIGTLMLDISRDIMQRALVHDNSKLLDPTECEGFSNYDLSTVPFNSPEFNEMKKKMEPAIDHHVTTNRHHMEYHGCDVTNVTLVDLLEMLCDWRAAGMRRSDSSIERSIETMGDRYNLSEDLRKILKNTAEHYF